jgi:hypothetical protein
MCIDDNAATAMPRAYSYAGYGYPAYGYGGYYRPGLRIARRVAIHRARWR